MTIRNIIDHVNRMPIDEFKNLVELYSPLPKVPKLPAYGEEQQPSASSAEAPKKKGRPKKGGDLKPMLLASGKTAKHKKKELIRTTEVILPDKDILDDFFVVNT